MMGELMSVGIVSWGSYVPKLRIKVEDIASAWSQDADTYKKGLLVNEKTVPGLDEDTITISVEAARQAISKINIDKNEIGAIYIGSESHPYAVKSSGSVVGEALMMHPNYFSADLEFACKAGTSAIQIVMGLIKSGMIEYGIAGGADTAQSKPGDALEYTASAGGAFFILGTKKIVAKINETISYITDTPDFWRKAYQKYPVHGGSFTGEPAYYKHVIAATEKLMEKVGTKPDDYNHVVFHQPNGKFPRRAAKKLGFNEEQLKYGLLVGEIGNPYSGASILGLANVLDNAKPGERILLTSYGSGAGSDSFDIVVTDEILNMQKNIMKGKKLQNMIDDKKYVNYTEYRRLIE